MVFNFWRRKDDNAAPPIIAKTRGGLAVVLTQGGPRKINVIKELRDIRADLGLVEAKTMVERPLQTIKENLSRPEAEEIKQRLEGAGATVEIR